MSALGQKQTFCDVCVMSALPPKADICSALFRLATLCGLASRTIACAGRARSGA